MHKYTLYLADVGQVETWIPYNLCPIVDGFTIVKAIGCYKGQLESSFVITIFCDELIDNRLTEFIADYCDQFDQESVLLELGNYSAENGEVSAFLYGKEGQL